MLMWITLKVLCKRKEWRLRYNLLQGNYYIFWVTASSQNTEKYVQTFKGDNEKKAVMNKSINVCLSLLYKNEIKPKKTLRYKYRTISYKS